MREESSFGEELVYHYTSLDAMQKIVASESIWCTAISYLNDLSERDYVLSAVRRRLPQYSLTHETKIAFLEALGAQDVGIYARTSLSAEQFVASFSRQSDSLTHWRNYCPNQSGVAMGFRVSCLKEARIDEAPTAGMVVPPSGTGDVRYLDADNATQIDNLISFGDQEAKSRSRKQGETDLKSYARNFRNSILMGACVHKHSSFELESEYRLLLASVALRENNIKFRTVRSTLIPYVSMRVPTRYDVSKRSEYVGKGWDALGAVVIGPTANAQLTEKAVSAFLQIRGIQADLRQSRLPYRDW